jgi:hypothetical protein
MTKTRKHDHVTVWFITQRHFSFLATIRALCLSDVALPHRSSLMTISSNLNDSSLHATTSTWMTVLSHRWLYKCKDQWIEDYNLSPATYINLWLSLSVSVLLQIDGDFIPGHSHKEINTHKTIYLFSHT